MSKYEVTIKEVLKRTITVDAENRDDAVEKVSAGWHNSEYILEADSFDHVEFTARKAPERGYCR